MEYKEEDEVRAYAKRASSGAFPALDAIDPHEVAPSINLYIVVLRWGTNPNLSIIKPKKLKEIILISI